ncbi:hypothetical protein KM043_017371 [Ampulex compressa]|nr:hypothetical protein KM043_017371 [Ampulex compressa]
MEKVDNCKSNYRYVLLLAPFQPQIRIEIEALINTKVECFLNIKNTSNKTLNVSVTKRPAANRQIFLNLSSLTLESSSNAEVCITWTPREIGCWRDVLQFTDSRNIKYDVIIIAATKEPKKRVKPKRMVASSKSNLQTVSKAQKYNSRNEIQKRSAYECTYNIVNTPQKKCKLDSKTDLITNKENIFDKANNINIEKHTVNFTMDNDSLNLDVEYKEKPDTVRSSTMIAKETAPSICIEISPPKKLCSSKSPIRGVASKKIAKDRSTREQGKLKRRMCLSTSVNKNNSALMSAIKSTILPSNNASKILRSKKQTVTSSQSTSDFQALYYKPSVFLAQITEDPFRNNISYNAEWLSTQEIIFKKWLNMLLSPPEDLATDVETTRIDIGKIWQSCCKANSEIVLAETKETISARYHTSARLNALRKAAVIMYQRNEVMRVLSQISVCIEKGLLNFRSDRDLHKNIGLQKEILDIFLCYNPLWLRIGLETVYGEEIPLRSNNDLIRLIRFLITRFFTDPTIMKKYAHEYNKFHRYQVFLTRMNRFMLTKFLRLVYFLDYAKSHKLIGHDPCLFHKLAKYKDSQSILLSFSRETLSGMGDITKLLRSYDYVVSYEQTYLDEFHYAVNDVRNDLRDGVRLCRIMELITGARDLTQRCRVPSISRLQKVHNVNVALNALLCCGFELSRDIDAKNIADGHREKTLSLLWQIVYKYQAPRVENAVRVMQKWWRSKLWYFKIRNYVKKRKHDAAAIIQRRWRLILARKQLALLKDQFYNQLEVKEKAVRVLQLQWRRCINIPQERKYFIRVRLAVVQLQNWWRRTRECKPYVRNFKSKRRAAIGLQRRWRATKAMKVQRQAYHDLRNATICIQLYRRALCSMRTMRAKYLCLKRATTFVQIRWRGLKRMRDAFEIRKQRNKAASNIQTWWRAMVVAQEVRKNFLMTRYAARTIEDWWSGVLIRRRFIVVKNSSMIIQRAWRRHHKRRIQELKYKRQTACCIIQNWWRMRQLRRKYVLIFQKRRKAAITLQRKWRALLLSREERQRYLTSKSSILLIQRWWRTLKIVYEYRRKRNAIIVLQTYWRSVIIARKARREFLETRKIIIQVQQRYRSNREARLLRKRFLDLRRSTITVQSYWRAKQQRQRYSKMQQAAVKIQSHWRTKLQRKRYLAMQQAAVKIQSHWKAKLERNHYLSLKRAIIFIQSHYREKRYAYETTDQISNDQNNPQTSEERPSIERIVSAIRIQRWWREKSEKRRKAAVLIQAMWKGYKVRLDLRRGDICVMHRVYSPSAFAWLREAINALRHEQRYHRAIICLKSLDTISRLSHNACILLCRYNMVDRAYGILMESNKSVPGIMNILHATSILITLVKFTPTRRYVSKQEHAMTILKLLNATIEEKELSLHLATLMWHLCQDEDYARSIPSNPGAMWVLKSLASKIDKKKYTSVPKSKKTINVLPCCEPEWHSKPSRLRLFTDIRYAVLTIISLINNGHDTNSDAQNASISVCC